jgi:hypothetical protein
MMSLIEKEVENIVLLSFENLLHPNILFKISCMSTTKLSRGSPPPFLRDMMECFWNIPTCCRADPTTAQTSAPPDCGGRGGWGGGQGGEVGKGGLPGSSPLAASTASMS